MEKSIYNFFIKGDKYNLIYNAFTNMLLDVPERIVHLLDSFSINQEEFRYEELSQEEYKQLVKSGVLCTSREKQKQRILRSIHTGIQYRERSKKIILEIHPNSDCNFDCFYCYESKASRKRHLVMESQILKDIYKYLETRLKAGYNDIVVAWCGGEALLEADIVIEQQHRISQLCAQYNANIQGEIVTNGILLTPSMGCKLIEAGIQRARITIDGTEAIHNKRRRYPKLPEKNYETIIDNILRSDERLKISLRANIDQYNDKFIIDFLEDLIQKRIWPYNPNMYLTNIAIEAVGNSVFTQNKGLLSAVEICISKHNFRKVLYERYIELTKNRKIKMDFQFPTDQDVCPNIGYPSSWVIDADGSLLKCSEHIGNEKVNICKIEDIAQDIEKEHGIFHRIQPYTEANLYQWGCLDCVFLPDLQKTLCLGLSK
ncbi:MAG: radical SAM protein [Mangrovibacterium sp.]